MAHSNPVVRAKRIRNLTQKSNPQVAPRVAPVLRATREAMHVHGGFVHRAQLLAGMARSGDLAPRTIVNLIEDLVHAGWLDRRGGFNQRTKQDTRAYRLADWPS